MPEIVCEGVFFFSEFFIIIIIIINVIGSL